MSEAECHIRSDENYSDWCFPIKEIPRVMTACRWVSGFGGGVPGLPADITDTPQCPIFPMV
jgi:hypothetical protein